MMTLRIYGAGILAGAYKGKDISERTTLTHAVSDESFQFGRLQREAGDAFCNRKYSTATTLVDDGGWEDADQVNCPECLAIIGRMMVSK